MKKAIIIGAGPAGLTAGFELLKQSKEYEAVILEESSGYRRYLPNRAASWKPYGYRRPSFFLQG